MNGNYGIGSYDPMKNRLNQLKSITTDTIVMRDVSIYNKLATSDSVAISHDNQAKSNKLHDSRHSNPNMVSYIASNNYDNTFNFKNFQKESNLVGSHNNEFDMLSKFNDNS